MNLLQFRKSGLVARVHSALNGHVQGALVVLVVNPLFLHIKKQFLQTFSGREDADLIIFMVGS